MRYVDFHVHVFPDDLAERAMAHLCAQANVEATFDGTIAGLLRSMETAGIDSSVLQSVATKPSQVKVINDWSIAIASEKLIPFGAMHPDYRDPMSELQRIRDHGLKGIKIHGDYQGRFVDDPSYFPIYEALNELGMILMFHAGVDIGLPDPVHASAERMLRVHEMFPDLTIIAAHLGGFKIWDDVRKYLVGTDIYFDTSYVRGFLDDESVVSIIKSHGVDKILFASDGPWGDQSKETLWIQTLGLDEESLELITHGNAERILREAG